MSIFSSCALLCVRTSLVTGVWVQAGGPSERWLRALPGVTWGSLCPGNRTSGAGAPTQWPPPSHSRLDRSRLAPETPSDRNLSGRGGDGGEDGGRGRSMMGRGWAGKREVSEVSSWLPPPPGALINHLLSSPSDDGWSEWRGWVWDGERWREMEEHINTDAGEIYRNEGFIRPVLKRDTIVMNMVVLSTILLQNICLFTLITKIHLWNKWTNIFLLTPSDTRNHTDNKCTFVSSEGRQ